MSDDRWFMGHRDAKVPEGVESPPPAHAIRVHDCGDPSCHAVHILLLDQDRNGIAQATVSLRIILSMLRMILQKPDSLQDLD